MKEYVRVRQLPNALGQNRSAATERYKVPKGHGRVPNEVGFDPEVSDCCCRVYTIMASLEREGWVTAGLRLIAEGCGKSISTVHEAITALASMRHLEVSKRGNGKRSAYKLLSPIFQAIAEPPAVSKPAKRRIYLRPCARCSKQCKPSIPDGLCRKCLGRAEMRRIAEDVVRKDRRETEKARTA